MSTFDRITIDPTVCHGKLCIRGLRYPVENFLELLAGGMSVEQVLADYEDLEREDILPAILGALDSGKFVEINRNALTVHSE